jgi:hypothetical protein
MKDYKYTIKLSYTDGMINIVSSTHPSAFVSTTSTVEIPNQFYIMWDKEEFSFVIPEGMKKITKERAEKLFNLEVYKLGKAELRVIWK